MLAGVTVQELRAQFEIKNFEATCSVKSSAKEDMGSENDKCVEIRSGPLPGSAGEHFRLIVEWETKVNAVSRAVIPDRDSLLGVNLHVEPGNSPAYYVKFEAEVTNVDAPKSEKKCFSDFRKMARGSTRGWSPSFPVKCGFVKLEDIFDPSKGWLHAGTLRVNARLLVANDDECQAEHAIESNPQQGLSRDLAQLFHEGKHTDVTIMVRSESIRAHAAILMARSSVFTAMLSLPMCEGTQRVITITDLDATAVKTMIEFMYSGEICAKALESDDMALSVLEAAHRYDVPSLVNLAVQALVRRLDVSTVSEWFHVADLIGNVQFRARCLEFIRSHVSQVQGTEKFEEFVSKRPELLKEILASLFPPAKRQRTSNAE